MEFLEYIASLFWTASVSVILGEVTISLGYRINRGYLRSLNREVQEYQNLSEEASALADPATYRAVNREGNEAFGRLFFHKIALSAASLWPIFFALQWLQDRYASQEILIPGTSWEANYVAAFLVFYILAKVLFGKLKTRIPYFRSIHRMLEEDELRVKSEELRVKSEELRVENWVWGCAQSSGQGLFPEKHHGRCTHGPS